MSVGAVVRKVLGKRVFAFVGSYYRSVFVNLSEVANAVVEVIPKNAFVLDIGGGDGEPLNYLLQQRSDITVTMVDLSSSLGGAIHAKYLPRVKRMPKTSIRDYLVSGLPMPSIVMINDVVHHVPVDQRQSFFADLNDLCRKSGNCKIIIKDIEPGQFRSALSYWADKYISGDRNVSLVSRLELKRMMQNAFGPLSSQDTPLFVKDSPNYSIVFDPA